MGCPFARQEPREVVDTRFGDRVRESFRNGDAGGGRRDIDNRAASSALNHDAAEDLAREKNTLEVRRQNAFPFVLADIEDRRRQVDPGRVHQNIDRAPLRNDGVTDFFYLLPALHVSGDGHRLGAQRAHRIDPTLGGVSMGVVDNGHLRSRPGKSLGHASSKNAAASDHDRHFLFEPEQLLDIGRVFSRHDYARSLLMRLFNFPPGS